MRYLILILLVSGQVMAQKPNARFLQDSLEVGTEVRLSLSYLHSKTSDLVFPDSSFDFSPFRFVSSQFFETQKKGNLSLDSVIYTLVTYSIQDSLLLSPYILNLNNDKKIYADSAKIYFKSQITENAELGKIKPKVSQNTFHVKKEYNVFKLFYLIVGLIFILFLGYVFLREKIATQIELYKHYRVFRKFINDFKITSNEPEKTENIYQALTLWKKYIEKLTHTPVSSMSTSEIGHLYQNESLESALKTFDRAIFGKEVDEKIYMAFHALRDFAIKRYRYEMKLKQI